MDLGEASSSVSSVSSTSTVSGSFEIADAALESVPLCRNQATISLDGKSSLEGNREIATLPGICVSASSGSTIGEAESFGHSPS